MLDRTKCDAKLGLEVEAHLKALNIHTPMQKNADKRTPDERKAIIEVAVADIMGAMGLDMNDDSLMDTPKRVAKMYVNETMWGLDPELFPKCTVVANKMNYDTMVCERNIKTMSMCEHHLVTIDGKTTIAYIPNENVLGLSKLNRIVEYFARRPQIQERLNLQIAHALMYILDTQDVAVVIEAKHYCVASRGIEAAGSSTITASLHGDFMNVPEIRSEFYSLSCK